MGAPAPSAALALSNRARGTRQKSRCPPVAVARQSDSGKWGSDNCVPHQGARQQASLPPGSPAAPPLTRERWRCHDSDQGGDQGHTHTQTNTHTHACPEESDRGLVTNSGADREPGAWVSAPETTASRPRGEILSGKGELPLPSHSRPPSPGPALFPPQHWT